MSEDWTTVVIGEVALGKATFRHEVQQFEGDHEDMVWLISAKGTAYFLRGYTNRDNLYQVISFMSGATLRQQGNAVWVKYDEDGKLVQA